MFTYDHSYISTMVRKQKIMYILEVHELTSALIAGNKLVESTLQIWLKPCLLLYV